MSKKSRLDRAEQQAGGDGDLFVFYQDLDNENLYHTGEDGEIIYTKEQVAKLAETNQVIRVDYVEDWRGYEKPTFS